MGPALIVAGAALLVLVPGIPSFCPMRVLLRVPCPTCGMTRATRLVLAGQLAEATRLHPLWPVVLATAVVVLALEVRGYVRRGEWGAALTARAARPALLLVLAAVLIVWIARFFGAFGGPAPV